MKFLGRRNLRRKRGLGRKKGMESKNCSERKRREEGNLWTLWR